MPAFVLDGRAGCRVPDAVVVVHTRVIDGERHAFFDHERVGVAVDRWVYAQAEDVLVVWSQDSGSDSRAIGTCLGRAGFCWDGGEDTGRSNLEGKRGVLGEVEGEDVLVIGDCDDGLQDENAGSCHDGVLRAEVGVLPEDAVVLFVAADYVGQFDRGAFGVVVPGVKVLYGAYTG